MLVDFIPSEAANLFALVKRPYFRAFMEMPTAKWVLLTPGGPNKTIFPLYIQNPAVV